MNYFIDIRFDLSKENFSITKKNTTNIKILIARECH